MAEKKEKVENPTTVVFWADPDRTFGGTHNFGDEVTGLIDAERQEMWLEDGTISEEKPDSTAHASQTKLSILTAKVAELEAENAELKSVASKAPKAGKGSSKKIKELEAQVAELSKDPDERLLEKDIEIENLTEKVKELGGDK